MGGAVSLAALPSMVLSPALSTTPLKDSQPIVFPVTVDWPTQIVAPVPFATMPAALLGVTERDTIRFIAETPPDKAERPVSPLPAVTLSVTVALTTAVLLDHPR